MNESRKHRDFDPTAEMLVNDFDDERTMEEEEAMESSEDVQNELDELQKEGDMPIEELLSMYGYNDGNQADNTQSSSSEEILSNADLTLDKEEIARDLLQIDDQNEKEMSVHDLLDSVDPSVSTSRLLRSAVSHHQSESESESDNEDYVPDEDDDWKKTIQVGSDYQAVIPEGLCKYDGAPAYENDDKLLWDPSKVTDAEVDDYLRKCQQPLNNCTQVVNSIPAGSHVRDDEQALYLLLQCGHNIEEAMRRRRMQAMPPVDTMSLWSEEECRSFENGLRIYGKDFHLIQQNKVRTRSVGELVQFYYLWKKTERHDVFANKSRLEKRKYALHPGTTDYMDRFLDEQENPSQHRDRSSSPNIHSMIAGDHKRQQANRTPPTTGPNDERHGPFQQNDHHHHSHHHNHPHTVQPKNAAADGVTTESTISRGNGNESTAAAPSLSSSDLKVVRNQLVDEYAIAKSLDGGQNLDNLNRINANKEITGFSGPPPGETSNGSPCAISNNNNNEGNDALNHVVQGGAAALKSIEMMALSSGSPSGPLVTSDGIVNANSSVVQ